MDSKDFKQLILDRMAKGETMEDILAAITATANEIEAEASKNKSNAEVREVLEAGTAQLIADLAYDAQPLDERTLMLVIMTWLCENTNLLNDVSADYDFAGTLDKEAEGLKEMIAGIDLLAEIADIFAPKKEAAKVEVKVNCDPIAEFFKKNRIM